MTLGEIVAECPDLDIEVLVAVDTGGRIVYHPISSVEVEDGELTLK